MDQPDDELDGASDLESNHTDSEESGSDYEVDGSQGRGPGLLDEETDDSSSSGSEAERRPRLHVGKRQHQKSTGQKKKG